MELSYHREGRGEPLVLLHGLGSHWPVWTPVLPALARERDVLAVDLPGFGGSPLLPSGEAPSAAALARAVARFLTGLGLVRPHVAGNSLGGWVAIELARLGIARSVTAISPAGFWNEPERRWARASLATAHAWVERATPVLPALTGNPVARTLSSWQLLGKPWRAPADWTRAGVEAMRTAPGWQSTLDTVATQRFEGREPVRVPTTIAWGTRDALLFPWQGRRALRALPGARLARLHGCGHVPLWDDPERVATVLLAGSARR